VTDCLTISKLINALLMLNAVLSGRGRDNSRHLARNRRQPFVIRGEGVDRRISSIRDTKETLARNYFRGIEKRDLFFVFQSAFSDLNRNSSSPSRWPSRQQDDDELSHVCAERGKNGKQAPTNPVTLIVKPRRKDRVFSWKLSWPASVTATKAARA